MTCIDYVLSLILIFEQELKESIYIATLIHLDYW